MLPWIINGLREIASKRSKNKKAGEGLDDMILRLQAAGQGAAATPQQQAALQKQLDPMLQMLTGNEAPQMSPVGTAPTQQPLIDMARDIQTGRGNQDAFNYLANALDPSRKTEREADKLANMATAQRTQQLQTQHQAAIALANNPGDPDALRTLMSLANPADLTRIDARAGGMPVDAKPSSVREHIYRQSLSDEDDADFMMGKRAGQLFDTGGGATGVLSPTGSKQQLTQAADVTALDAQRQQEMAVAGAKGAAQGAAVTELPGAHEIAYSTTAAIDGMLANPALDSVVGQGWFSTKHIPGTQAANFVAQYEQVKGQVFMQGYQMLKGGGTITEIEAAKAEKALNRMDTAQSPEAFREAAAEFQGAVSRGYAILQRTASGDFSAPDDVRTAPRVRTYVPGKGFTD